MQLSTFVNSEVARRQLEFYTFVIFGACVLDKMQFIFLTYFLFLLNNALLVQNILV